ncbi:uncharacterized protein J8A68_005191 [[Candida] subhashii]|uniref:Uncharacterized protein n=1 Tax=[Candida] subhashii TaxID=561895 RepID=A0A8J5QFX0_9ASCO|nr:uncharacterized protein J8A68_005191 [[Candida] subhashii]KAG7661299.1 hypothetical protein J8A68_005191 [[Candida] subhashii]
MSQPPQKKQKTGKQIIYLPDEIGELIVSYIPDHYLEANLFTPLIGEFIAMKLYRYIHVGSLFSKLGGQLQFKFVDSQRGLQGIVSQSFFNDENFVSAKDSYTELSVNQFVQLSKKYPRFKPHIIHFHSLNRLFWMHHRYPEILRKLPRVDVSLRDDSNRASSLLELPYNIYSISDIPKVFTEVNLLSNISGLCADYLPQIADKSWGKDLQELELGREKGLHELPHLFPNLKKLRIDNLESLGVGTLRFPSKLQCLNIRVGHIERLDVSYLDNLTEFVAEIGYDSNKLDKMRFPLGIERVILFCAYYGPVTEAPANLEIYPNLRDFRIFYSYVPLGIDEPNEVSVTVGELLKIPDTLRILTIDLLEGQLLPDNLKLPPSLRVLSISNTRMSGNGWSSVTFPETLTELTLQVDCLEGIELPKSLQRLYLTTTFPIESVNFLDLKHLVNLKLDGEWVGENFICSFPSSLETLQVLFEYSPLEEVVIEASNLKQVAFKEAPFKCIGTSNFELPDCVESLSFDTSMENCLSEMEEYLKSRHGKIERNIFPSSLRELYLASNFLEGVGLQSYSNLEKLELLGNNISRLDKLPSSLKSLRLDGSPICKCLTPTIFSDLTNLRELRMADTKINEYFESDQSRVLNFPSSLVILNLSNNKLQLGVAPRLLLSGCTQLQELWLSGNSDMTDVQVIIDTVKSASPEIVELRLDEEVRNRVKEGGVNFLSFVKYTPGIWQNSPDFMP